MCFCDGCCYLITNKSNGEKHLINGDGPLYEFFKGAYCLPFLLHRLMKKEYVQFDGVLYAISANSHLKCQRVKMDLAKMFRVQDFDLWEKCPEKYRHLLPSEGEKYRHLAPSERQ